MSSAMKFLDIEFGQGLFLQTVNKLKIIWPNSRLRMICRLFHHMDFSGDNFHYKKQESFIYFSNGADD